MVNDLQKSPWIFRGIVAFTILFTTPLFGDWRDDVGYTRLNLLSAGDLSVATSDGFAQIEASTTAVSPFTFMPDTQSTEFTGKTFTNLSAASGTGVSGHATKVATNFYSNTNSLITGNCAVDNYFVNDWLNSTFLNSGTNNLPLTQARAVENHSWIAQSQALSTSQAQDINRRLDFAINRDGFVCVVGMNNGNSNTLPQLLCQTYNTLSVGRDDGEHSAGLTDYDGVGRCKPELVGPSASPENATSWTTPMVASAAGVLYSKLTAVPYSLTGADLPRVIKSLLLASATKNPHWVNTTTRPLDARYGAGILNLYHAYHLMRSGRVEAASMEPSSQRAWAAETVNGLSSKTYHFTIPAGSHATPFCAALNWYRISSRNRFGTWTSSMANLNLELHTSDGTTLLQPIVASESAVDNVELISRTSLGPGTYALVVRNISGAATAYALAWHSLPSVSIEAIQPIAAELDAQPATIRVTRTGDPTLSLLVPLSASGNAVAGVDYTAIPSSIVIPAGQSSITLNISPLSNQTAQGNRTLNISIASDFGLVRDAAQAAVVTIEDKPFDAWRLANFNVAELDDPLSSGYNADPDRDNLPNLWEFALALDPQVPSRSPLTVEEANNYLILSVTKNPVATDVLWSGECSGDLQTWQATIPLVDTPTNFSTRDIVVSTPADRRFIRLKIGRRP